MGLNIIKEGYNGTKFYGLEDEMFMNREIECYGPINMEMAVNMCKQLRYLERESAEEPIKIYINSNGGEVHQGLLIYDTMRSIECPIHTVCTGAAYSMAATIFSTGDTRSLYENSQVMIHDPSVGIQDRLNPEQMEHYLRDLKKVRKQAIDILKENTGQKESVLLNKLKKDTYFKGQEAVDFGLADAVIEVAKRKRR